MKTLVMGLFDDVDAARGVLQQLADSPLDLRGVTLLHRDADIQDALAREADLPSERTVPWIGLIGALLGGFLVLIAVESGTAGAVLEPLGPVLSAALGAILGAGVAVTGAVLFDRLPLPADHQASLASAVESGATAVIVNTDSVPTARAIADLFEAAGSRDLVSAGEAAEVSVGRADAAQIANSPDPSAASDASSASEDDLRFRPPDRRRSTVSDGSPGT